jgi:hypothetical protein
MWTVDNNNKSAGSRTQKSERFYSFFSSLDFQTLKERKIYGKKEEEGLTQRSVKFFSLKISLYFHRAPLLCVSLSPSIDESISNCFNKLR